MPRRLTHEERVAARLEWAQSLPCGGCGEEPRLQGDHLGAKCRAREAETHTREPESGPSSTSGGEGASGDEDGRRRGEGRC